VADLGDLRFGPSKKKLADLTDAELDDEVQRRRAARGGTDTAADKQKLAQLYASLELPFGAPKQAIESAYERLRAKYAPERFKDPDRHATAVELVDSLKKAYEGLLDRLKSDR
jgi:DnaJ-class molecular chaperone